MIKKKILVLGSNIYQESLIEKINKKKYKIFVASTDKPKTKFPIEKFYKVSVKNKKKIFDIFLKNKMNKVISTGSDHTLEAISYINFKLNLDGLKKQDFNTIKNKYCIKKFLVKNKIITPKLIELSKFLKISKKKFTPLIIKKINSSGSRGVYKINNHSDIFKINHKYLLNKNYIIEEQIIGNEFGANVIFYKKKIIKIMIFEDILFNNGKTNVPIGHIYPSTKLDKFKKKIFIISSKIIKNLKCSNGILNLDFIINKFKKIFLLEFSIRFGATGIPELLQVAHNINFFDIINGSNIAKIKKALNFKINYKYLSILAISEKKGILNSIVIKKQYKKNLRYSKFINKGEPVKKFNTGNNALGFAVFQFDNSYLIKKNFKNYFEVKIK